MSKWPYDFTIGDVMARAAAVAARYADDDKKKLETLAAVRTAKRAVRTAPAARRCGYCGGARPCLEHNDLPADPSGL